MLNELNNISLDDFSIVYNNTILNEDNLNLKSNDEEEIITTEIKRNTILNTDNNYINWNLIEEEIETLDSSWSIILLDLYNSNSQNIEVIGFGDKLNDTIISIKNRNKNELLINLRDLYSYIPKFIEMSNISEPEKKEKQAKLYLINAYVSSNEDDWENVKKELLNCELVFNDLANSIEYVENREYKANKVYILIKEIEETANIEDKKIFFMKYKNLMQSINSL